MTGYFDLFRRSLAALAMVGSIALLERVTGPGSPWFAVIAAFVLLGLFDLFRPYLTLPLPRTLRTIAAWEHRGTVYRRLGVMAFGRFLRHSPLRLLNRQVYLAEKSRNLNSVQSAVIWSETAHIWGAFLTLPYLAVAIARGWWAAAVALLVFNLVVNLYPILHLRWVRIRLNRGLMSARNRTPPSDRP